MKNFRQFIFASFLLLMLGFLFSPVLAVAQGLTQAPGWEGLVPCGRSAYTEGGEEGMCTLCDLVIGIHRIFTYGVYIITSIAFLGVFLAGGLYIISSGEEGMMTQAKAFLRAALTGFVLVIGAWLIVNETLYIIGYKGPVPWSSVSCSTGERKDIK